MISRRRGEDEPLQRRKVLPQTPNHSDLALVPQLFAVAGVALPRARGQAADLDGAILVRGVQGLRLRRRAFRFE
jgi:hypothetical protein